MASSTLSRHVQFSDEATRSRYPSKLTSSTISPAKKQKMSITQTYYVAHTARAKLAAEASKPDHDLRLLVGHANLLDSLMLELADAEREQERWFNHTVSRASRSSAEPSKPSRWADTIVEEPAEDWSAEDADSMSESSSDSEDGEWEYDEDEELDLASAVRIPASKPAAALPAQITITPIGTSSDSDSDSSDVEEDEQSSDSDLALVRTASHQPPELLLDDSEGDESSSDEDSHMPPSPPQLQSNFVLSEKERQGIATTSFYDARGRGRRGGDAPVVSSGGKALSEREQSGFFEEGFYLPQRAEVGAY